MTSKKLGALLRTAPPAIARTEAPEPALHAVSEAVVELERPTRPATKLSAAEPEVPLQVLILKRVRRQLAVRAAQEGRSLRSLVLMALRGLGIDVSDGDIKGKRGQRNV